MRVCVIGLGYVGLVTSAGLARWGNLVVGIDASDQRIDLLLKGDLPLFEPGLDELVATGVGAGLLRFAKPSPDVLADAEVVITAFGTHDGNGGWQTRTMNTCLMQVVPHLRDDAVLVVRSTLPPEYVGDLAAVVEDLRNEVRRPMIPVLLNPEFTREARAVRDFLEPDRIVLGVAHDIDGRGEARLRELYAAPDAPILTMAAVDAAFAKLGANLFLATKMQPRIQKVSICQIQLHSPALCDGPSFINIRFRSI
jgi:UDPglucose 6-dehydrogenase